MKSTESAQITRQIVKFLKNEFAKAGFLGGVIALSGGVDSAVSCCLGVRALGKEHIFPLLLPHGELNKQGITDALIIIKQLGIPKENVSEVNIKPIVDLFIPLDPAMDDIRRGNIMARVRMIILYDQAKKQNALVIGTENKTEHLLGYFTRFGDDASDIEPLRNLYKTEVIALARYLGVPAPILTKAPTAGLWPGQTDEGDFGFTYKDADEILSLLFDEKKSVEEIVAAGWERGVVEKVKSRADKNSFKHHLPIIL